jgi:hypothetical protein
MLESSLKRAKGIESLEFKAFKFDTIFGKEKKT